MVQLLKIYRHSELKLYYTASMTAILVVGYTGSDVTFGFFFLQGTVPIKSSI